jgi:hypothetical protein
MLFRIGVKAALRNNVELVRSLVSDCLERSRTEIARSLCQQLQLHDFRGRPQQAGCLKALRELADEGLFCLPSPQRSAPARTPRRLEQPVPEPHDVPDQADMIQGLRLVVVDTDEHRRIWNELIAREHPYGTKPMVGRQLLYLIESDHGMLGAIGLCSPALHLAKRERWIGWDNATRRTHLERIVGLARLLVRPSVRSADLVSRVLKMLTDRVCDDFERVYNYRPWLLETFAETDRHTGACYRAAGWLWIGPTTGRGRQDTGKLAPLGKKDIFLHVLDPAFRRHLGIAPPKHTLALSPGEGLDSVNWADNEFGEAELGDRRLTRRLVAIAGPKGKSPTTPFSQLVTGNRAASDGYYRFVEQATDGGVDMDSILACHRERTVRRMQGQRDVLCIHDTTDLNFSTLKSCQNLGVIGKNQTSTQTMGLRLHTALAVEAGEGVPLGLVSWQCDAPEPPPEPPPEGVKKPDPRMIPAEQKESWRWVEGLRNCIEAARDLQATRTIHVMDREGDFFELFHQWRQLESERDELLVRAKHNRCGQEGEQKIFEQVASLEPGGQVEVLVPRKSARAKKGKRAPEPARKARTAVLTLRWQQVVINPPSYGPSHTHPPVLAWLLHAREEHAPANEKALEWFLLTTIDIDNVEIAIELLGYYAKRWRIEDWHRILKTCCRAEKECLRDADFLRRVLAINMVVAWRVHLMTLLGREVPDLPMETLFSDVEIKVLKMVAKREKLAEPVDLASAVKIVARLGGYYDRPKDPPPGALIMCRGTIRLMAMSDGVELMLENCSPRDNYG